MGGLEAQEKKENQKREGKDKRRKEHRQRPGDKKVWNMWELSEAGALGKGRKEREAGGMSGCQEHPRAFSSRPPTSEGCHGGR